VSANLQGKVAVITGASSGIGQVAAERLAAMGARIVQVARDRGRGEAALERLRSLAPAAVHTIHYADLARLSEMRRVGAEIAAAEPRIDLLLNNAGALFGSFGESEGLERTFALNHVSYFVMAHALRERLAAAAPARVVNTASDAHLGAALDFDDLQSVKAYRDRGPWAWLRHGGPGFKVYGRSKLCNILFTRELARRLEGTGVTANCLHPGFIATRFGDQSGGLISFGVRIAKRFALSLEEGAATLVYLASSPEAAGVTGEYFVKCRPAAPSREARDDAAARRLWQATLDLVQPAARAG
jgi:NAD(P)-dependent dehydrogenase (short-subunit alcohol dehydrogenase family)